MSEDCKIISPNEIIKKLNNSIFCLKSSLMAQAWNTCYQELGRELGDKADGVILLTVGLPSSGKTQAALTEENMAAYDVIFDGGCPHKLTRSAIINISIGAGWEIDCLHMTTPYNMCRNRNHRNANGQRIPFEAFRNLAKTYTEPKSYEGFRKILKVDTSGLGQAVPGTEATTY